MLTLEVEIKMGSSLIAIHSFTIHFSVEINLMLRGVATIVPQVIVMEIDEDVREESGRRRKRALGAMEPKDCLCVPSNRQSSRRHVECYRP